MIWILRSINFVWYKQTSHKNMWLWKLLHVRVWTKRRAKLNLEVEGIRSRLVTRGPSTKRSCDRGAQSVIGSRNTLFEQHLEGPRYCLHSPDRQLYPAQLFTFLMPNSYGSKRSTDFAGLALHAEMTTLRVNFGHCEISVSKSRKSGTEWTCMKQATRVARRTLALLRLLINNPMVPICRSLDPIAIKFHNSKNLTWWK